MASRKPPSAGNPPTSHKPDDPGAPGLPGYVIIRLEDDNKPPVIEAVGMSLWAALAILWNAFDAIQSQLPAPVVQFLDERKLS